MFEIIVSFMLLSGYTVLFFGIFLMSLAGFNKLRFRKYKLSNHYRPMFSLIVPAHNEEKIIERTIKKFLETTYPSDKKEIIIVNDGSADNTEKIVKKYASKVIDATTGKLTKTKNLFKNIILVNRKKGGRGKSYALNDGIKYAKSNLLFFIDADIQLSKNVFERAARHFIDKKVGALTGYVAVEKKKNILNKFIDFEYVVGQKILRRGFNVIGVHYIIPGGCAIIRKELLEKVGGYHHDTLAEDTDLSWRIITETKSELHFDPSILVKADEPNTLLALWHQRIRWNRGNLEVTWKNKKKIGRLKHGRAVTLGYPFWITSMILPFAFLLSAGGLILATTLNIYSTLLPVLGRILGIAFYGSWIVGTILNKGRSWFAGLMNPGILLLIIISTTFIWHDGVGGLMNYLGYPQFSSIMSLIIGLWIFISIPGTYFCIKIAKRYPKIANFLQLGIFGYWMFLVTSIFHGYISELKKSEKEWIRTKR